MKAVEHLYKTNVIAKADYHAVAYQVSKTNARSEEVIISTGVLDEAKLLTGLAAVYKAHFVTSERLAAAEIPRPIVELVPRALAEKLLILPVHFDAAKNLLSIGTPDPEIVSNLDEARKAAGVKEIRAFIMRPATVLAGIKKFYAGDAAALTALLPAPTAAPSAPVVSAGPAPPATSTAPAVPAPAAPALAPPPMRPFSFSSPGPEPGGDAGPASGRIQVAPPAPPSPMATHPASAAMKAARPIATPGPSPSPLTPAAAMQPLPVSLGTSSAHETLERFRNIVGLIEGGRQELRGHSSQVAGLILRLGEYMGLDQRTLDTLGLAAMVHDLGKLGPLHINAREVSTSPEHSDAAQKTYDAPLRVLESLGLSVPKAALDIVAAMYERFDGKGIPNGLAGQRIPLGARMLAVVDTYADLIRASRLPERKAMTPQEAIAELGKHGAKAFDQDLIDNFRGALLGGGSKETKKTSSSTWSINIHPALIIDASPDETNALEFVMTDQGFDVKTARTLERARELLNANEGGGFHLVISELDFPDGDGLTLLEEIRKETWGKELPWIVLTSRQGGRAAQKSYSHGVLDFMAKPMPTDLIVAKSKALLDKAMKDRVVRGVSGSLQEMGLGDIVQVLFYGKKTGKLTIRTKTAQGEVHFLTGNIANATWGGMAGVDAFYAMVRFTEGNFAFDPAFEPKERLIEESNEALLLEGMRRMDEDNQ